MPYSLLSLLQYLLHVVSTLQLYAVEFLFKKSKRVHAGVTIWNIKSTEIELIY